MKKKSKMFDGEMIEIPVDFLFVEGDNTFSWRDRSVYLFILAFKKVMGKDPSRGDFRAYSGMSLATVRTVLNKFKGLGLVDIKYRKNRGGTGFKVNEHILKAW